MKLEYEKFQVRQKPRIFNFGLENIEKKDERQGKVWEFYEFSIKLNVSRLLNCIIPKNCKQFMFRNITFLIFII